MYFPKAFDAESLTRIEQRFPHDKRILVGDADALRFACNAINVGRVIVLNEVSAELSRQLESLGFRVVQVSLTEFLKAGGAAKCLALRLSEMDATHAAAVRLFPAKGNSARMAVQRLTWLRGESV